MKRAIRAAVLGALLLALAGPAGGVGPPVPSGKLTVQQSARLSKLRIDLNKAAYAGQMGRALRLAQEAESLRRQWQGSRHWQAIDAHDDVEHWARLARLSEPDQ